MFSDLEKVVETFKPGEIVADNYPRRCLETVYELSEKGVRFYRLADLRLLAECRRLNGVRKNDENDVKTLRELRKELIRLMSLTEQWLILNCQTGQAIIHRRRGRRSR